MKKVKKIAKRLRARAEELRQNAVAPQHVSTADAFRAGLTADVLQEVADQLAPRPKKMLKDWVKATKAAKKAAKAAKKAANAPTPSTNNNAATHEPNNARAGVGVGG
jgi:phosphohistidine phosphatase SixA